jgi:hypothetical protein
MDNNYIYTPAGTDVTIRWRKSGWVPPSELPEYQAKWKYYQELPLRKLADQGQLTPEITQRYEESLRRAKVTRIR